MSEQDKLHMRGIFVNAAGEVEKLPLPELGPPIKLLGKLHAVMTDVERIKKDKRNTAQNYDYASEQAIKEALHTAFVKHGVFCLPSILKRGVETTPVGGGRELSVTWVEIAYTFYEIETGEQLSGIWVGSGSARDEKGFYAAITGAIKYLLTSVFLIPTGDDPDNDEKTKKVGEGAKRVAAPTEAAAAARTQGRAVRPSPPRKEAPEPVAERPPTLPNVTPGASIPPMLLKVLLENAKGCGALADGETIHMPAPLADACGITELPVKIAKLTSKQAQDLAGRLHALKASGGTMVRP